jgi:hypothetical protein
VPPHRSNAEPKALPVKGVPKAFAVVSRVPPVGIPVAVVVHGAVLPDFETGADGLEGGITTRGVSVVKGANGFVVRATDGGLRPAPPISVEPNGMPTGPTDELDPIPVPDEAIGADPAKEPPLAAQVPTRFRSYRAAVEDRRCGARRPRHRRTSHAGRRPR